MNCNNKKIIIFDLDDTLSITKTAINKSTSDLLVRLLDKFEVCVISGGSFEQMKVQLLDYVQIDRVCHNFHIMPTCGTKYYLYNKENKDYELIYQDLLSDSQKELIIKNLNDTIYKLKLLPDKIYGKIIEDRGSQITFSACGQDAPADIKYKWDSDGQKRKMFRDYLLKNLDGFEINIAGTTSIDITKSGIDKSYGIKKLIEKYGLKKSEILFFGDKISNGGNDYPVFAMGVDCIEVGGYLETERYIKEILSNVIN